MTSQPAADVARAGREKWHSELLLRKLQGLPDFGFLGSLSLEHRRREVKPGSKHRYDWDIPFNARWPWNSLVGGHLTLKRVTELSQKDHKQRIARYRLLGSVTNLAMFQNILVQQTYSVCQCSILIDTMLTSERFLHLVFGEAPEQAVKHDKPACRWCCKSWQREVTQWTVAAQTARPPRFWLPWFTFTRTQTARSQARKQTQIWLRYTTQCKVALKFWVTDLSQKDHKELLGIGCLAVSQIWPCSKLF